MKQTVIKTLTKANRYIIQKYTVTVYKRTYLTWLPASPRLNLPCLHASEVNYLPLLPDLGAHTTTNICYLLLIRLSKPTAKLTAVGQDPVMLKHKKAFPGFAYVWFRFVSCCCSQM